MHPTCLSFGMPAVVAAVVVGLTVVADAGATDDAPAEPTAEQELPAYHLVAGESIARERWVVPVRSCRLTGRFGDVSG